MTNKIAGRRVLVLFVILALLFSTCVSGAASKKIKSKSVALDASAVTLCVGDIATLDATMKPANSTDTLTWTSSNKAVASVNKYGTITAKKAGTAKITVKTTSKKTATCKVTVKKYQTAADVKTLISGNTLKKDDVISLIGDYSISEEKVVQLIKDNVLSESAIETMIKNNVISEDTVIGLIKENALSKEDVVQLIQDSVLSEAQITELIEANTFTKEDIVAIVQENTLTKAEVIALIEEYAAAGNSASGDWEDGTELSLYSGQTLPFTFDEGVTITDVEAKKYHYDDFNSRGAFCSYKYEIVLSGTCTAEGSWLGLTGKLSNGSACEQFEKESSVTNFSESGEFVININKYCWTDYSEIIITTVDLSSGEGE